MYRKNRISVITVILLAFLFTIIYLTDASLTNPNSTYSNSDETGIHFHGEIMRFSTSCNLNSGQDYDISISEIIQNYESVQLKSDPTLSGAFQQDSKRHSGLWIAERSFQKASVCFTTDMYQTNVGNMGQRNGRYYLNNSPTMSCLNSQEFTLSLFPHKKMNRTVLINSRNDTTHMYHGFYSLKSFPAYLPGIQLGNQYGVQNDIIDPGDPPDGDAIPVPDGFYFLLFLGVIYTCCKININNKKEERINIRGIRKG
jgi:hypothetical protein